MQSNKLKIQLTALLWLDTFYLYPQSLNKIFDCLIYNFYNEKIVNPFSYNFGDYNSHIYCYDE